MSRKIENVDRWAENSDASMREHERQQALAQLGARVLEILEKRGAGNPVGVHRDALANSNLLCAIDAAARSLGLIEGGRDSLRASEELCA